MPSMSLLLSLMNPVWANTWTVTSGGSIQSTIDASSSGDTIEVGSGTYFECLDPSGKNIDIVGTGTVLINGSNCTGSTITLSSFETINVSNVQLKNTNGLVLSVGATATATLDGVSVAGSGYSNQSQSSLGGVIYVEGNLDIYNSTFSANSGGLGGVIYTDGGIVSVGNSTFSSNSALNGGVIYARDGSTVNSTNNTFQNNVVSAFGGVYCFRYGVDFTEVGSSYDSNQSTGSNGGVLYADHNVGAFLPNTITISDAIFDSNQAPNGTVYSGNGGVLYVYHRSTVTITNSEFLDNSATKGGAIWVVGANDTVSITSSTFTDNSADQSGAVGVMANGSTYPTDLTIVESSFIDNIANADFAGAVSLGDDFGGTHMYGAVTIQNSYFENNVAQSSQYAYGGAVFIQTSDSDNVSITDTIFDSNTADASGGGLYINTADIVTLTRNRFWNNEASSAASYDRNGGGIRIESAEQVLLNNSIFCGNNVTKFVGGIVRNAYGGAVSIYGVEDLTINNVIFQENESDEHGGALALGTIGDASIVNNTFVGNSSSQGDDLWLTESPTEIINTIFAHSSGSASVYAADATSAAENVAYNDWYNNTSNTAGSFGFTVTSNGNIVNDPIFTLYSQDGDCENDVLTLQTSSTLIDGGDPTRFDLDGTRSDIGAFGGTSLLDSDLDGFGALVDCDDNDANAYPGAAFLESTSACMLDADGDGYGDGYPSNVSVQPGQDCDDGDFTIKPGGIEICDGIDNDCDNQIDDNPVGGQLYYTDTDGDGIGGTTTIQSCSATNGASVQTGDCDDLDPFTFPGSAENDSSTSCMRDVDADGYGDSAPTNTSVTAGTDCDDMQPSISPVGTELPADGVDQNCDGYEDCFQDSDLDGFGSTGVTPSASFACSGLAIADNDDDCDDDSGQTFPGAAEFDSATACMADDDGDGYGYMIAPTGGVGGNDCDDTDPSVYFGAPEIPGDGISQDCDNVEDCYVDNDGDGFGSTVVVASLDLDCTDDGEAANSADCDDTTIDISPDAPEIPYDGIDQDCDPSTADDDLDGDGYGVSDGDCDDANPDRNPGATDIPDDGIDQDCDGEDATEDNAEPSGEIVDPDTGDTDINEEDLTDKGQGCSTVSGSEMTLMAMLFALVGVRRRR